MHTYLLSDAPHEGLILLFSGWGTGFGPFLNLRKEGYDILLIEDYRDFSPERLESEILKQGREWQEVIVVAWSFGVRAATDFLQQTGLNVTLRLAINGTPQHIDGLRGIPPSIFQGTLRGLDSRNLRKFLLRTAGSKEMFEQQLSRAALSEEKVTDLRDELEYFGNWPVSSADSQLLWDRALVSENDRIFPPENQLKAWDATDVHILKGAAHLPDFQHIITEYIVRKDRVATKFGTTRESYTENASAQKQTALQLFSLLKQSTDYQQLHTGLNILEIGQGDGTFTRLFFPWLQPKTAGLILADISEIAYKPSAEESEGTEIQTYTGDVETSAFEHKVLTADKFDFILSASALQWLNSPAMLLKKCAAALKPGGILAVAFYGEGTLREQTDAGGTGLKYPSAKRLQAVAEQSGLQTLCSDSQEIVLRFKTPLEALRHLNLTGVNALPSDSAASRTRSLLRNWPLDDRGEATLTFAPRYLLFRKP